MQSFLSTVRAAAWAALWLLFPGLLWAQGTSPWVEAVNELQVFPSGTSPDGKAEVIFKPGSKENTRPQAGPRGLWRPSESTLRSPSDCPTK